MALLPQVEQVYAALMGDVEEEGDHIVITDTTVALETARGRLLGEGSTGSESSYQSLQLASPSMDSGAEVR